MRPKTILSWLLLLVPAWGAGGVGDMTQRNKIDESSPYSFSVETDPETQWEIYTLSFRKVAEPGRTTIARIVPAAGSNLISLQWNGTEILHTPPAIRQAAGVGFGVPVLYPTPNRVRDSQFTFDGHTFRFPPNNGPNFIHGLVNRAAWNAEQPVVARDGVTLATRLDFDESFAGFQMFPIRSRIRMTFTLEENGVRIGFAVENLDRRRLPFGFALHPYFRILGARSDTFLRVPAVFHMEAQALLPTGKLDSLDGSSLDIREFTSLETLRLDDVYYGMAPERPAVYECRAERIRVTLEASEEFGHAVVYTPSGRPYFCIENQTCSTDAHNLHSKGFEKESRLRILNRGERASGSVRIRVSAM